MDDLSEDAVLQADGGPVARSKMPASIIDTCEVCGGGVRVAEDVAHPVHEDCA